MNYSLACSVKYSELLFHNLFRYSESFVANCFREHQMYNLAWRGKITNKSKSTSSAPEIPADREDPDIKAEFYSQISMQNTVAEHPAGNANEDNRRSKNWSNKCNEEETNQKLGQNR